MASCTLQDMDDALDADTLATVIPFPRHRVRDALLTDPQPDAREEYWALVQRLSAERRALAGGTG